MRIVYGCSQIVPRLGTTLCVGPAPVNFQERSSCPREPIQTLSIVGSDPAEMNPTRPLANTSMMPRSIIDAMRWMQPTRTSLAASPSKNVSRHSGMHRQEVLPTADQLHRGETNDGAHHSNPVTDDSEGSNDALDRARVEALLLLAKSPLSLRRVASMAGLADATRARTLVAELNERYNELGRAFHIESIAGGVRLMTRPVVAPWLGRLGFLPSAVRLSWPMMETLAVVAYRQDVTRAEVEATRGVTCGEILRQLMQLDLVRIAGRSNDLGRPYLYGTTKRFLKICGLPSLKALPPIDAHPIADDLADSLTSPTSSLPTTKEPDVSVVLTETQAAADSTPNSLMLAAPDAAGSVVVDSASDGPIDATTPPPTAVIEDEEDDLYEKGFDNEDDDDFDDDWDDEDADEDEDDDDEVDDDLDDVDEDEDEDEEGDDQWEEVDDDDADEDWDEDEDEWDDGDEADDDEEWDD